jgi:DNA ligase (NAD+)
MSRKDAAAEHTKLSAEIVAHDLAYHQNDAPTISDADYDALRKRLLELENHYPTLAKISPSQKVGAAPSGKFAKVQHAVPMLSLANAFADEDVAEFLARMKRFLNLPEDAPLAVTAEPKIDGLCNR